MPATAVRRPICQPGISGVSSLRPTLMLIVLSWLKDVETLIREKDKFECQTARQSVSYCNNYPEIFFQFSPRALLNFFNGKLQYRSWHVNPETS